ncbi:beta-myrcene/E-beta-ocimene synthase 2, chloroplastic isoform X2 [Cinnamomum micranthum f. kanehirae]|uniref:Beta-myrcene/E-beta-ocimene synthase 2, chloroplastic isoform X2 n=1 Tax=Cinnamomum micranthum f. kanehirae TaxID=337451 RepID=A0A443NFL1_9MAGN|nr:beta-myrcene/E-beta-ocimene synthase 2, chloroplastic isoform X2 [Cinnamomum micranthum f. kanehirae]
MSQGELTKALISQPAEPSLIQLEPCLNLAELSVTALSYDHHKRLKETIQRRLQDITQPHNLLGLIDAVQHLGVAYQFEQEISDALNGLHSENTEHAIKDSLHHTSLYFRLLRQHGCNLSSGIYAITKSGLKMCIFNL